MPCMRGCLKHGRKLSRDNINDTLFRTIVLGCSVKILVVYRVGLKKFLGSILNFGLVRLVTQITRNYFTAQSRFGLSRVI